MCAATSAIVAGGGALLGGVAAAVGSSNAAGDQENAASNATNTQLSEFNTANQEGAGGRSLGYGAENQLSNLLGLGFNVNSSTGQVGSGGSTTPNYSGFESNPGFQFATQLGQQAISRQAGASGNLYSTNTLANLGNYTQGQASQNYNNYVGSLLQSAGLGTSAATNSGNQAITTGQGVSNSLTNVGQAQASGASGVAGSIAGLAGNNNFLNSLTSAFSGSGGGSGGGGTNGLQTTGAGSGGAGAPISYNPLNPF